MATCHWHPGREATARCGNCGRQACDECATQMAEPPGSYYLCPECLRSLETLVERGFEQQARGASRWRALVGAALGCGAVLVVWLGAMSIVRPTPLMRWAGYLSCGIAGALAAVWANGGRRSDAITAATVPVVFIAIAVGHYVGTNIMLRYHFAANPEVARESVETGILAANQGWWLPTRLVLPFAWHVLTWMDGTVVLAGLYLAYALTHRKRLWRMSKVRPSDGATGPSRR